MMIMIILITMKIMKPIPTKVMTMKKRKEKKKQNMEGIVLDDGVQSCRLLSGFLMHAGQEERAPFPLFIFHWKNKMFL